MIDYLSANWSEVTLEKGHEEAKAGKVVVGGRKDPGNGHVVVIYPGDKIESGGYDVFDKKQNMTVKQRTHGKFPPCISTSSISSPGAMCKGDKTVWDPWRNDSHFKEVRFWTPKGETKG
jgi:hypothetical protein